VAKPELGTKRVCPETGRKFYDLNKDPVISPYTGKVVPVELPTSRGRPEPVAAPPVRPAAAPAPAPAEEAATPEPQEAEFVSLEDAEAESQGSKAPVETTEPDIEEEVEMDDESLDDSTFIEEQEEEDADVTDIIGGDIEDEEEG
jgi:uncharacterized protein (TIGR02300 family)